METSILWGFRFELEGRYFEMADSHGTCGTRISLEKASSQMSMTQVKEPECKGIVRAGSP